MRTLVLTGDAVQHSTAFHPFRELLDAWTNVRPAAEGEGEAGFQQAFSMTADEAFVAGTTRV